MSHTHKALLNTLYFIWHELHSVTIYKLICLIVVQRETYSRTPDALKKRGRMVSGPDVVRVWSLSFPHYTIIQLPNDLEVCYAQQRRQ